MSLVELTEFIVKNLVSDPDSVSVKEFEEDEYTIIEVIVSDEDIKKVIGKNGKIANALRTVVQASSYANKEKKVKINIDSL
jgi:predicted RNA-binding protein YlqC (UPF0109 family)